NGFESRHSGARDQPLQRGGVDRRLGVWSVRVQEPREEQCGQGGRQRGFARVLRREQSGVELTNRTLPRRNRMLRRLASLALLLLLVAALPAAAGVTPRAAGLRASVDGARFVGAAERAVVTVTIANHGPADVYLLRWQTPP